MAANQEFAHREDQLLLLALTFEFGNGKCVMREQRRWPAEISMRNSRASGSLAQRLRDFVLMLLCGLMLMTTSPLETTKGVGGAFAEAEKMAVQSIPEADGATSGETGRELHRQRPVTGASQILT
jgi:hypothetical protein